MTDQGKQIDLNQEVEARLKSLEDQVRRLTDELSESQQEIKRIKENHLNPVNQFCSVFEEAEHSR